MKFREERHQKIMKGEFTHGTFSAFFELDLLSRLRYKFHHANVGSEVHWTLEEEKPSRLHPDEKAKVSPDLFQGVLVPSSVTLLLDFIVAS